MTTIQITHHYSRFVNVADRFSVGNNEADGNAAVTLYTLPEGYTVEDGCEVCDPAGWVCAIVLGDHGGPVLMSRGGGQSDVALVAA